MATDTVCGEGYEKICMAHDICRLKKKVEIAGPGLRREKRMEIIEEWLEMGLLKYDKKKKKYDTTILCQRYEEYVKCIKAGGKPIWVCFKSTLGRPAHD